MKLIKLFFLVMLAASLSWTLPYEDKHRASNSTVFDESSHLTRRAPPRPPGEPYWGNGGVPVPANEDLMYRCQCKGWAFYGAFYQGDAAAGGMFTPWRPSAHSRWNYGDLQRWGWHDYPSTPENHRLAESYGVDRALRELGLSDKAMDLGGLVNVVTVWHADPYSPLFVDEQTYPDPNNPNAVKRCTNAIYVFGFDSISGSIITMNIKSPKVAGLQREPEMTQANEMPNLQSSSDIIWAIWQRYTPQYEINNLKWWFSVQISNLVTRSIVKRALDDVGLKLGPYPGHYFALSTPAGQAILGSPNGVGLGYFLVQHKPEMGNMKVNGVVVFHSDESRQYLCIAFAVAPVGSTTFPGMGPEQKRSTEDIPIFPKEMLRSHIINNDPDAAGNFSL